MDPEDIHYKFDRMMTTKRERRWRLIDLENAVNKPGILSAFAFHIAISYRLRLNMRRAFGYGIVGVILTNLLYYRDKTILI